MWISRYQPPSSSWRRHIRFTFTSLLCGIAMILFMLGGGAARKNSTSLQQQQFPQSYYSHPEFAIVDPSCLFPPRPAQHHTCAPRCVEGFPDPLHCTLIESMTDHDDGWMLPLHLCNMSSSSSIAYSITPKSLHIEVELAMPIYILGDTASQQRFPPIPHLTVVQPFIDPANQLQTMMSTNKHTYIDVLKIHGPISTVATLMEMFKSSPYDDARPILLLITLDRNALLPPELFYSILALGYGLFSTNGGNLVFLLHQPNHDDNIHHADCKPTINEQGHVKEPVVQSEVGSMDLGMTTTTWKFSVPDPRAPGYEQVMAAIAAQPADNRQQDPIVPPSAHCEKCWENFRHIFEQHGFTQPPQNQWATAGLVAVQPLPKPYDIHSRHTITHTRTSSQPNRKFFSQYHHHHHQPHRPIQQHIATTANNNHFPNHIASVVICIWNEVMPQARHFIGLAQLHSPMPVSVIVVTFNLNRIFERELLTIANVVILRMPWTIIHHHAVDMQMAALLHVTLTFPSRCVILFDISTSLWKITSYLRRDWEDTQWAFVNGNEFEQACQVHGDGGIAYVLGGGDATHPPLLMPPNLSEATRQVLKAALIVLAQQCSSHNEEACKKHTMEIMKRLFPHHRHRHAAFSSNAVTESMNSPTCYLRHVRRSSTSIAKHTMTKEKSRTLLCLALPTRSTDFAWSKHRLFRGALGSIRNTTNSTSDIDIRVYIGFEENDLIFLDGGRKVVEFMATVVKLIPNIEVHMLRLPSAERDLVYLWNELFNRAFTDGCDYLQQITDDVDFVNTPGVGHNWHVRFITLLKKNGNLGMIGHDRFLNTMPLVHRSHIEALGTFFPTEPHNVLGDYILYAMYNKLNLLRGPEDLGYWENLSNQEGRSYSECLLHWSGRDIFDSERLRHCELRPERFTEYLAARVHE